MYENNMYDLERIRGKIYSGLETLSLNGESVILEPNYPRQLVADQGLIPMIDQNGKMGFIDTTGQIVVYYQYEVYYQCEVVSRFSEGLAAVKKDGKFGYINLEGALIIDLLYDYAHSFQEGVASVEIGGLWGLIDKNGNSMTDFVFEKLGSSFEGMIWCKVNGVFGFINTYGRMCIQPKYAWAKSFSDGLAKASYDAYRSDYFYIDKSGKEYWSGGTN
jgi:hypothetical protein